MIGSVSQVGSGDASSVLDLESADGHVWRRRWVSCVQRGSGTVVICLKYFVGVCYDSIPLFSFLATTMKPRRGAKQKFGVFLPSGVADSA
jgi:hypothetical protein